MKKFIALMLAMVMVFALCACGNDTGNKDKDGDQASTKLKILDSEYVTEDYAIGIAKENTALLDKVNAALKELKDDGTLKTVTDYFIAGTGTLPEVQKNVAADAEELVMATNATFPPYESVDGDPYIGLVSGVPGFCECCGHGGEGIALSPATGEAIAELLIDGHTKHCDISRFSPDRVEKA